MKVTPAAKEGADPADRTKPQTRTRGRPQPPAELLIPPVAAVPPQRQRSRRGIRAHSRATHAPARTCMHTNACAKMLPDGIAKHTRTRTRTHACTDTRARAHAEPAHAHKHSHKHAWTPHTTHPHGRCRTPAHAHARARVGPCAHTDRLRDTPTLTHSHTHTHSWPAHTHPRAHTHTRACVPVLVWLHSP